jgi:hypothetical protein
MESSLVSLLFRSNDFGLYFVIFKLKNPLVAFSQYIGYERRAKHPDLFVTRGIYERAIAEAAKWRFDGKPEAEEALRIYWSGYGDVLVNHSVMLSFRCTNCRSSEFWMPAWMWNWKRTEEQ